MLDYLYDWVRNIILFIVLKTIINNLLGKSSYKKYVNLITGFILLILVITPLFQLFRMENKLDYFFSANNLLSQTKDIQLTFEEVDDIQSNAIIGGYKEQLEAQITTILEAEKLYIINITTTIEEDSSSVNYGQIKNIDVICSYVRKTENADDKGIDKITIDKISISGSKDNKGGNTIQGEENKQKILSPDEINAKKRLSDFYNLNTDNINISIQE